MQAHEANPNDALARVNASVQPPVQEEILLAATKRPRNLEGPMSKQTTEEAQPKMTAKEYEKELRKLQTELCRLQDWIVHAGLRVVVLFEGRDAAGKGGTIKAIMQRVNPRVSSGCVTRSLRSRAHPDIRSALSSALSRSR